MKPVFVFDGDCGFCRYWIERWRDTTGDRVEYAPYQEAAGRFPDIPDEDFAEAVHLIEPDGSVSRGAEAVFRSLATVRSHAWPLWLYGRLPGFAPVTERLYRLVASHRPFFTRWTRRLWGRTGTASGADRFSISSWLFPRLLALVYLVAFLSLAHQITGLIGADGIVPVTEKLDGLAGEDLGARLHRLPTLLWIDGSDTTLRALCWLGAGLSVLLLIGAAPVPVALSLWILYLSLTAAGDVFLSFQWDALLLETGFAVLFLLSWRMRPGSPRSSPFSNTGLWLLRLLLFKLMFCSGVVKLSSSDPAWRDLTALTVHYETQPLPTWIGWWAHQLPLWFHKASTVLMYSVELVLPFFIFAPRRLRHVAAVAFLAFQVLIALTGNYGFFNILSVILILPIVDDAAWRALARRARPMTPRTDLRARHGQLWPPFVLVPVFVILLALDLFHVAASFRRPLQWAGPLIPVVQAASPFRLNNGYGLFSVMTMRRPEIVVEGSEDGVHWTPYGFPYKPGPTDRRPVFVGPHMPRLDWQMWFAALGSPRQRPWFLRFAAALLENKPGALSLLSENPFPDGPPEHLRARLFDYRFTTPAERRATGNWWKRELLGTYLPAVSRRDVIAPRRRPSGQPDPEAAVRPDPRIGGGGRMAIQAVPGAPRREVDSTDRSARLPRRRGTRRPGRRAARPFPPAAPGSCDSSG